ncbi:MAG TPA: type II secretion system F family protein [Longimicrobium sp.]
MNAYTYVAVDASSRRVRGREHAPGADALTRELEKRGLLVLEVREAGSESGAGGPLPRRRAVVEATRAIAALLGAGIPLTRALRVAAQVGGGALSPVLDDVRARVERGDTLAEALGRHPRLFSPLYVGVVRAGERAGDLGGAFTRLADHLEKAEELRSRLVSASIYPLLLAVAGGTAVLVLLLFVLPRFAELLEGSGAALPASTAMLLAVSTTISGSWPWLLGGLVALVLGLVAASRTERGRTAGAHLLLLVPGIGALRRAVLAARFARLLGVLVAGGTPLLHALEGVSESLADPLARDAATRIRAQVREGTSLREAVAAATVFPPLLAQLVAVGEESGQLGAFLVQAAEMFEGGAERSLRRLVALAEPAMIILFGGIVGFVALALLQAIYGVNADAFR